eukprot:XP_001694874.1 predicted protein [Chlamydomonas reinhardtii]
MYTVLQFRLIVLCVHAYGAPVDRRPTCWSWPIARTSTMISPALQSIHNLKTDTARWMPVMNATFPGQFYAARISPAAPTHCIDGDLYGVPWRMAALCLQFDARGVCSDIELFEFFMMNCI